jgi:hypothetical protein
MATTYNWTVDQMYTLNTPEPGFVVNVLWTLTGFPWTVNWLTKPE